MHPLSYDERNVLVVIVDIVVVDADVDGDHDADDDNSRDLRQSMCTGIFPERWPSRRMTRSKRKNATFI